jgi:hypothetical protein
MIFPALMLVMVLLLRRSSKKNGLTDIIDEK